MTTVAVPQGIRVRNILYVTDFSKPSEAALPFAIALARTCGAEIHALHALLPVPCVITAPETIATLVAEEAEIARSDMQALETRLAGLPHQTSVVRGSAVWPVIQQAIQESNADLIVLGTHGRSGALKFLLGSVAEEVLRRSPIPVLTIGPAVGEGASSDGQFRRIMLATDFTADSAASATFAVALAQENHARLILLHVLKPRDKHAGPRPSELSVVEAIHQLYETVPKDAQLWCPPDVSVEYGEPAAKILETADLRTVDLIVLGVHDGIRLTAATHLGGNTAHKVVANAPCPVLTVAPAHRDWSAT
jgi:nucleotide-binding universal stress UspA family protein